MRAGLAQNDRRKKCGVKKRMEQRLAKLTKLLNIPGYKRRVWAGSLRGPVWWRRARLCSRKRACHTFPGTQPSAARKAYPVSCWRSIACRGRRGTQRQSRAPQRSRGCLVTASGRAVHRARRGAGGGSEARRAGKQKKNRGQQKEITRSLFYPTRKRASAHWKAL